MNTTGHPVEWRGRTLHLGELTAGVKKEFCTRLKRLMVADIRATHADDPDFAAALCLKLHAAPPSWTTVWDDYVREALNSPGGTLLYYRLLFGATDRELPDDELSALLQEKRADPASDFSVAVDLIARNADPKAGAGSGSSPAPSTPPSPNS